MTNALSLASLRATADEVAMLCNAPDNGVVVSVDFSHAGAYRYAIWTLSKGAMQTHYLHAAATPRERLMAHVQGFIENYRSRK